MGGRITENKPHLSQSVGTWWSNEISGTKSQSGERVDSSVIPAPKSQSVGKLIEVDDGDKGKEKN